MTTLTFEPINHLDINNNKCFGRMKSKPELQCNRYPKINGLCNSCYNRSNNKTLVLITEPYKKTCIKIKKRTKKKVSLINLNDIKPDTFNKKKVNVSNLKYTLKHFNIKFSSQDKKDLLVYKLDKFYKPFYQYSDKIHIIKKLQSKIKTNIKSKTCNARGPALFNRSICVNDTDFFTCDDLIDIPENHFFSYKFNGTVYGFDIRSFAKLLEFTNLNPYDKHEIPKQTITTFNNLFNKTSNKLLAFEDDKSKMTPAQLFDQELLRVFDIYENLKYYTDIDWFKNLNLSKLRRFYLEVQDIWAYRASLTNSARENIVPGRKTMLLKKYELYKLNFTQLRKIMIKEMENFASKGTTQSDKVLGALLMITGLVIVSPRARLAYPDLWQTPAI